MAQFFSCSWLDLLLAHNGWLHLKYTILFMLYCQQIQIVNYMSLALFYSGLPPDEEQEMRRILALRLLPLIAIPLVKNGSVTSFHIMIWLKLVLAAQNMYRWLAQYFAWLA